MKDNYAIINHKILQEDLLNHEENFFVNDGSCVVFVCIC